MDFILMSIWFEGTAGKRHWLCFHYWETGFWVAKVVDHRKKREWDYRLANWIEKGFIPALIPHFRAIWV